MVTKDARTFKPPTQDHTLVKNMDNEDIRHESSSLLQGQPTITNSTPKRWHLFAALITLLVPTAALIGYETGLHPAKRTDQKTLVLVYVLTATVGLALVGSIQAVLAYATGYLCFGADMKMYMVEATKTHGQIKDAEHIARRKKMSRRWQYWVWMLLFAFVMAGLNEELLKYFAIVGAERFGRVDKPHDYIMVAIAASLGFATLENIGFIYTTWSGESAAMLGLTVAERVILSVAGHAMMAVLTSVGVMARDFRHQSKSILDILWLPVLFHGVFDFSLFAISAFNGNVGWVHPREKPKVALLLIVVTVQVVTLILVVETQLQHYGLW